jgi:hypothetical protein
MFKAGSQRMDLQSLRYRGSFILSPSDDFCDLHRRHQILLDFGQHRIRADLQFRVAGMVVTTSEAQAGNGDTEKGETW